MVEEIKLLETEGISEAADLRVNGKGNNQKKRMAVSEKVQGLIFALIPLFGFCLFTLIPAAIAFAAQFVSMDGYNFDTMQWNNFANFKTVYSDPLYWRSFGIDLFFVATQFCSLLIAIVTAAFLAQRKKGAKFFTVLFFIPQICSSVAIALMWQNMFDVNFGIVNTVLVKLFGEGARVNWTNEVGPFLAVMFIITIWQAPGYGILMYKAAFTNVNENLYEAARLDGANRLQQFFHITLPAISPTTFFLVIAGINAGMQTFDLVHVLGGGGSGGWTNEYGPENAGMTTSLYIYQTGIALYNPSRGMPVAAVMSYGLFAVMLIVSIINFKFSDKWVSYDQ
ncbi:MAG: sugar ABC transporter permease [Clostridiales bacterium]|nr:sugar ABC transporter permease [Clostridiales bacterium]